MGKNKTGRPTKLTASTVRKLEEALKLGASTSEACRLSGISRDTFYRHFNSDQGFSDKMEEARSWIILAAKRNVAHAVEAGNLKLSVWLLDKHMTIPAESISEEMPEEESPEAAEARQREFDNFIEAQIKIREHRRNMGVL